MLTDKEILDYLDESMIRWYGRANMATDMQIGDVVVTVYGRNPRKSAREHLSDAIEKHASERVARSLTNG